MQRFIKFKNDNKNKDTLDRIEILILWYFVALVDNQFDPIAIYRAYSR